MAANLPPRDIWTYSLTPVAVSSFPFTPPPPPSASLAPFSLFMWQFAVYELRFRLDDAGSWVNLVIL